MKRSNGEGNICKVTIKGKQYWRIQTTLGYDPLTGKQKRKNIYGKTQKEAKAKLKEFLNNNSTNSDKATLGAFAYDWLWNIKKQELKNSSFDRLEGIYRNYIKPNNKLYNARLTDIDTLYMQKVTNELLKSHTVRQIKDLNRLLNSCFNYAIAINKIKNNPCNNIVYPRNNEVEEEKNNYITEEQQQQLIKELQGDSMEGIILIALLCGLRLGEAMALQVKDIDFNNKIIRINKSVKYVWTGKYTKDNKKIYEYKVTMPKTKKSIREVPLHSLLIPILKNTIRTNKENKLKYGELYFDNSLIFCKDTGEYIDSKQPNRHLKAILKKADIKADIHYHSLRHIFITNCISKDINVKTVMDWVGHTDVSITMGIYAEVNKNKNNKEYEKINCMFT